MRRATHVIPSRRLNDSFLRGSATADRTTCNQSISNTRLPCLLRRHRCAPTPRWGRKCSRGGRKLDEQSGHRCVYGIATRNHAAGDDRYAVQLHFACRGSYLYVFRGSMLEMSVVRICQDPGTAARNFYTTRLKKWTVTSCARKKTQPPNSPPHLNYLRKKLVFSETMRTPRSDGTW